MLDSYLTYSCVYEQYASNPRTRDKTVACAL